MSWLWPDHAIGKGESRQLREDHNALVNAFDLSQHNLASWEQAALRNASHAEALAEALRDIMNEFAESDNDAPHLNVWKQAKQALARWEAK